MSANIHMWKVVGMKFQMLATDGWMLWDFCCHCLPSISLYILTAQCLRMCAVICITESEILVFHPSYDCSPHLYSKIHTSMLLCNTAQTL